MLELSARVLVLVAPLEHLVEPLLEAVGLPEEDLKREDEFACLLLDRAESTLGPALAQVEDAVIEVATVEQPTQVHEVAVVARPIERLVERREALLPVEHEIRGGVAVEGGCAGDLARC